MNNSVYKWRIEEESARCIITELGSIEDLTNKKNLPFPLRWACCNANSSSWITHETLNCLISSSLKKDLYPESLQLVNPKLTFDASNRATGSSGSLSGNSSSDDGNTSDLSGAETDCHTCPIHSIWVGLSSLSGGLSPIATGSGNGCMAVDQW